MSKEQVGGKVACPECGKLCAPHGLGVHRARKHGVAGKSATAVARTAAKVGPAIRRGRRKANAAPAVKPPGIYNSLVTALLLDLEGDIENALELIAALPRVVELNQRLRHSLIASRVQVKELKAKVLMEAPKEDDPDGQ